MTDTTSTPANTQLIPARDVIKGDIVLGCTVQSGWTGKLEALYHSDPYVADPQADKPGCQCPGHEALEDEDRAKTLVVLYDGENWDYACDVVPADDYVIIKTRSESEPGPEQAPQAEQAEKPLPELRPLGKGCTFDHNGRTVYVFPTPQNPGKWSARPDGCKTVVSHRKTRDEAVRAAISYLNGDDSQRTGWDKLAELLSL